MTRFIIALLLWLCGPLPMPAQVFTDPHSLSLMDCPLEGPDSVFLPNLKGIGFEPMTVEDGEPGTYYFHGSYYGLKARLVVSTSTDTRLLSTALVSLGPYSTYALFDKNQKYLLRKIQQDHGNLYAKGDGSLHKLTTKGYVRFSNTIDADKSRNIQVLYLTQGHYFKDALNMGLFGNVREVVTENPVSERRTERFEASGRLVDPELIHREYAIAGYLLSASTEEGDTIGYEYDEDLRLLRRTARDTVSGDRIVTEYTYDADGRISTRRQRIYDTTGQCSLTMTQENDYSAFDDHGNWTHNRLHYTYDRNDGAPQQMELEQTRTISYWE